MQRKNKAVGKQRGATTAAWKSDATSAIPNFTQENIEQTFHYKYIFYFRMFFLEPYNQIHIHLTWNPILYKPRGTTLTGVA